VKAFVLLALLGAVACRSSLPAPVDFSETPRTFVSSDYGPVFEAWTRSTRVVSEEGTLIEVWATMKSLEFRQAYIERYAELYKLSRDQRDELQAGQLEAIRRGYELHLSVQMSDRRWNDLERDNSPWRVTLVDGAGDTLDPSDIDAPRLPVLYESEFFPNKTPFTRTYVVRFDKKDENGNVFDFGGEKTGQVMLRIASPRGAAEMVWTAK